MAYENNGIGMLGCSINTLWGFPSDDGAAWNDKQLKELKTQLTKQSFFGSLVSLNSIQLEAKQILEDNGFVVLGRIISNHSDRRPAAIEKWIATGANDKTTVYLLGKGFYTGEIRCKPTKSKAVAASKLSLILNVLDRKMRSAAKKAKS